MKLSRRCFLSFVVGGAAGTALTPLPWKLTDDLSIWSQNWPWTPVPTDGAVSFVNSTCDLCSAHCGITVRTVDNRAIKIEGQEANAFSNRNGICPLGLSGLQLLYGPIRVQGPLKRIEVDGSVRFQPISWRQAIEEVVSKMAALHSQGKPEAVACLCGREVGTVPKLIQRLLHVYGSPNFICMPSADDAYASALRLTQGIEGFVGLDVENTDFILSFGSALLDGYGSPPRMMQAVGRLTQQSGTLVQIETRLSNTAAKASKWLAPKPGTEAALALGMANVIISQGRLNTEFVNGYTEGFEAFAAMVAEKYAPSAVAEITGIPADTITQTALAFAGAKHPMAICGRGKGQTPVSLKEVLAVQALNALVGSINRKGGIQTIPTYDYLRWPEMELDTTAMAGITKERLDNAGGKKYPHVRSLAHRFVEKIDTAPGELGMLLVAECNPCYSLPDSDKVKAAFDKIPFIVSFSSFWDETAMQADLILPNHVYLERFEDLPVMAGTFQPIIGLCQPVVAPLLNTQHLGDTMLQIARSLQGSVAKAFPWNDYESCLMETLGDQWATMSEKGFWASEAATTTREHGFNTPSGKFILMDGTLGAIFMADAPAASGGDYPLQLVPYDSIRLSSGYIGATPFMIKAVEETVLKGQEGFAALNPETAIAMGLEQGQPAMLITPVGQAKVRVHLDDGIVPGVVCMPRGLGHTAYDGFLAAKGVNINQLVGTMEDPASGLDAAWGIRAKLVKA
jgi:anaerobic selenocysteine-containing dehydrogenase